MGANEMWTELRTVISRYRHSRYGRSHDTGTLFRCTNFPPPNRLRYRHWHTTIQAYNKAICACNEDDLAGEIHNSFTRVEYLLKNECRYIDFEVVTSNILHVRSNTLPNGTKKIEILSLQAYMCLYSVTSTYVPVTRARILGSITLQAHFFGVQSVCL